MFCFLLHPFPCLLSLSYTACTPLPSFTSTSSLLFLCRQPLPLLSLIYLCRNQELRNNYRCLIGASLPPSNYFSCVAFAFCFFPSFYIPLSFSLVLRHCRWLRCFIPSQTWFSLFRSLPCAAHCLLCSQLLSTVFVGGIIVGGIWIFADR